MPRRTPRPRSAAYHTNSPFLLNMQQERAEQSPGGRPFAANPRTRTACSESARRSDSPCPAPVAPCAACAARALVVSAPPAGAGGARVEWHSGTRGATDTKRRGRGEDQHSARTPLLDCRGESHPWCTRAPRASRARRLSLRAPLPRFARSGDHRKDARQGRRPATENRRRSSQLRT